jgi:hypothetical protein
MAKTYHSHDGRFCPPHAAKTVVKDGEHYKVVRQHRRIKRVAEMTAALTGGERWRALSDVISALMAGSR